MNTLVLDNTNESLEAVLDSAISTNQPHYFVTYADSDGTSFTEASSHGVLNGTTAVTMVSAPGSGVRRVIKSLFIYNADDASNDVTLQADIGGTKRILAKEGIGVEDTLGLSNFFPSGIGSVSWGDIIGNLSNQTDLYEEGSWTPTLETTGTDFDSVTYDLQDGTYVVIGNLVVIRCRFRTDGITFGSASGSVEIGGLPYSPSQEGGVNLTWAQNFAGDVPCVGQVFTSPVIRLRKRTTANGDLEDLVVADLDGAANSNYIRFNGTYRK